MIDSAPVPTCIFPFLCLFFKPSFLQKDNWVLCKDSTHTLCAFPNEDSPNFILKTQHINWSNCFRARMSLLWSKLMPDFSMRLSSNSTISRYNKSCVIGQSSFSISWCKCSCLTRPKEQNSQINTIILISVQLGSQSKTCIKLFHAPVWCNHPQCISVTHLSLSEHTQSISVIF